MTGGRILSVNTYCDNKQEAIDLAYENIRRIKAFKDPELRDEDGSLVFFRSDKTKTQGIIPLSQK